MPRDLIFVHRAQTPKRYLTYLCFTVAYLSRFSANILHTCLIGHCLDVALIRHCNNLSPLVRVSVQWPRVRDAAELYNSRILIEMLCK